MVAMGSSCTGNTLLVAGSSPEQAGIFDSENTNLWKLHKRDQEMPREAFS